METNGVNHCNKSTRDPFVELLNGHLNKKIIQILENRLPRSAHVFNMVLLMRQFNSNIKLYALNGAISDTSVLLLVAMRKDYGQNICISIPSDFKVTEEVKIAFTETKMIDWDKAYLFSAVDRVISLMIFEIATTVKGNSTIFVPNYFYYLAKDTAANLLISQPQQLGVEIKPLDVELGAEFMDKNWKYKYPGSADYIKEVIESHPSSGVYVDGVPVSGMALNVDGLMGMLHTAKGHRGKGYAQECMKYLMKQIGTNGFTPCSAADLRNVVSLSFHEKLGMTYSHECDYIFYLAAGF